MFNEEDVLNEGFKPLKSAMKQMSMSAAPAKPHGMGGKPHLNRGMSFNADTGAKESSQDLWEGSSWGKFGRSRGKTMDRANSFVVSGTLGKQGGIASESAIVIVDPFSTGAHLAAEVCKEGYKCVRVFSIWDSPVAVLIQQGLEINYTATIQHNDKLNDEERAIQETIEALEELPFPILAIIAGAETGVELADQLSHRMGLRSNGVEGSLARRNKYFMGEKVRETGIRTVKQATCTSVSQVHTFLNTLNRGLHGTLKCVVKPAQSAGSDDVFLCNTLAEAETAFHKIYNSINGLGLQNTSVLVQEYLLGVEYVVDKVSLNGEHKVVAVWQYDKRPINGASFVYFGVRLMSSTTKMAQVMCEYADTVLTALNILNGPSHMEIMLHTTTDPVTGEHIYDPCLVEVGARCQGGEGTWLKVVKECIGYTMVEVALDVYLTGELFHSINKYHYPLKKAGRVVDLVSRYSGIVRSVPGDAVIRNLPSFRGVNWETKPGDFLAKTIDYFTSPGNCELVADTEEEVERDYSLIHKMSLYGLVDYATICPKRPSIGSVVVVDPFSSGAHLAAMILQYGYKLVLVFSEKNPHSTAQLVSKDMPHNNAHSTVMIQHDNLNEDQDAAIAETLAKIDEQSEQGSPIMAILPGAESGVALAERLSSRYGTRTNGEEHIELRHNKQLTQDSLRKQGLQSVSQQLCGTEKEVSAFYQQLVLAHQLNAASSTERKKTDMCCVVKPNETVGSEHVFLCHSQEEAIKAFKEINNNVNLLGHINQGALVQEYLEGTEYIIDGVSRDGVYKIVAIWKCDKRSGNGANFVLFGMTLCDFENPAEIRAITDYARNVVRAMHIHQGPSHLEVINVMTQESPSHEIKHHPRLIEVSTRCHGGDATWLPVVQACIGYTQLEVTLNCYLRPDLFDVLPLEPPKLKAFGTEAFLISHQEGTVRDIPGIDAIRDMSSFKRMEMLTQPGTHLSKTIDSFTRPGSVQLVNISLLSLSSDYEHVHKLSAEGQLFQIMD